MTERFNVWLRYHGISIGELLTGCLLFLLLCGVLINFGPMVSKLAYMNGIHQDPMCNLLVLLPGNFLGILWCAIKAIYFSLFA